jgi:hypothetical protein
MPAGQAQPGVDPDPWTVPDLFLRPFAALGKHASVTARREHARLDYDFPTSSPRSFWGAKRERRRGGRISVLEAWPGLQLRGRHPARPHGDSAGAVREGGLREFAAANSFAPGRPGRRRSAETSRGWSSLMSASACVAAAGHGRGDPSVGATDPARASPGAPPSGSQRSTIVTHFRTFALSHFRTFALSHFRTLVLPYYFVPNSRSPASPRPGRM